MLITFFILYFFLDTCILYYCATNSDMDNNKFTESARIVVTVRKKPQRSIKLARTEVSRQDGLLYLKQDQKTGIFTYRAITDRVVIDFEEFPDNPFKKFFEQNF